MIAYLVVSGLVLWALARATRKAEQTTARRDCRRVIDNRRVRDVHAQAGNTNYPHVLANGRVRWYRVDHEHAMDL